MKIKFIFLMALAKAVVSFGTMPNVDDGFESYAVDQTFVVATNGWQASGSSASVMTNGSYAGSNAAFMSGPVALTNTLNTADPTLKVWSDLRIKPMLGAELETLPTNTSSFLCYFNSNGIVVVATAAGWQVCTNDIWGNPVAPASTNTYVRFSIFQDYTTSNQAVFLNDQLILQNLRFLGSAGTCGKLVVQNTHNSCWLDNVWVNTNVIGLASNRNNDAEGLADADEVQRYGYARRTFYVSKTTATNLSPLYTSMTNALAVCRARDAIHVIAGDYSGETITLAANQSNVVFEGDAFSVNSLVVASNASASFAQTLSCGTLTVSGQVAMASGRSVTATTAHVVGSLSLSGNGAFVVSALDFGPAGVVNFTSAQLVASAAGVTMNGTFAIAGTTLGSTFGNVTLSGNVAVAGQDFTVSNLGILSGAAVSFAQTVNCTGLLSLTGQVTMASGKSLSATTAHVVGSLSLSGNGAFAVSALDFGPAGVVNFTSAQLVASAAGVTMNGTFAITGTTLGSTFGNVTLSGNVAVAGQDFTVSNLSILSGAAVSFAQAVNCTGLLSLTGQMAMASGRSLTSSVANVAGTMTLASNAVFVATGALSVTGAGVLSFTNAQLVATTAGVNMTGVFAISNTWGTALVGMPLPFNDTFDLYASGTVMTNLKFRGWNASAGTVMVTNGVSQSVSNSVVLPDGTVLSNSINSAATKVWTDVYIQPAWGGAPTEPATNASSFLAYANENGRLVVATAEGWVVCSNKIDHTPAPLLQSNAFNRITICQDLRPGFRKFAVFVAGYLVAQKLTPPANNLLYSAFGADNRHGTAYVDDVLITTAVPPGLPPEADEINIYGQTIASMPQGSIYRIR